MVCSNCGYDVEVVNREKQREVREAIILTRQEIIENIEKYFGRKATMTYSEFKKLIMEK